MVSTPPNLADCVDSDQKGRPVTIQLSPILSLLVASYCNARGAYASPCRLQWIAVWRPIGHGADVPKIYCAQGMLRIIHIKLAANVAMATSKTESAEKKESVDAC